MKIRFITTNNLVFDLHVKGDNLDTIVGKVFDKKFIKVSEKTYINTDSIAIVQELDW